MKLARRLALRLLWAARLSDRWARRTLARGRLVVMLHGISRRHLDELPDAVQPFLDAADLDQILDWLGDRAHLLGADEFLTAEEPGVLLTFDDGYRNNHEQALPRLLANGAPAVFFVTTQHVAEPHDWLPSIRRNLEQAGIEAASVPASVAADLWDGMGIEEVRACAATPGISIGSHSVSHPFLTAVGDDDLERELRDSKRQLEEWTGRAIDLFAYPTGDYDQRIAEATERAGYRAAFADADRGLAHHPRFEIPRVGLYDSAPWYLAAKLCGRHRRALPPAGATP